jgi:predicted nucleotidyltransferase
MGSLNKEQIVTFLASHKSELHKRFGVEKIGLFGSFVRGEQNDGSDIDIVVEISGDNLSGKYFGVLHFIEDNLERKIDLGLVSSIRSEIRPYVLKEIEYV